MLSQPELETPSCEVGQGPVQAPFPSAAQGFPATSTTKKTKKGTSAVSVLFLAIDIANLINNLGDKTLQK